MSGLEDRGGLTAQAKALVRRLPITSRLYKAIGDRRWRRRVARAAADHEMFMTQAALQTDDIRRALGFALTYTRAAVAGDVAMFGLYGPRFPVMAAQWMKAGNETRRLHLFDSWRGYGTPSESDLETPEVSSGGWRSEPIPNQPRPEDFVRAIDATGYAGKTLTYEGWFTDTLPMVIDGTQFSVVVIDPGLFSAIDEVLTYLFSKAMIPEGAVIMFNTWNAARASRKHCARAAWAKAVDAFGIDFSDEGPFHWSGRKFIVHDYRR